MRNQLIESNHMCISLSVCVCVFACVCLTPFCVAAAAAARRRVYTFINVVNFVCLAFSDTCFFWLRVLCALRERGSETANKGQRGPPMVVNGRNGPRRARAGRRSDELNI